MNNTLWAIFPLILPPRPKESKYGYMRAARWIGDLNYCRSAPSDATLPANLAPALPLFCSFSRSFGSKGARADCPREISTPEPFRMEGSESDGCAWVWSCELFLCAGFIPKISCSDRDHQFQCGGYADPGVDQRGWSCRLAPLCR